MGDEQGKSLYVLLEELDLADASGSAHEEAHELLDRLAWNSEDGNPSDYEDLRNLMGKYLQKLEDESYKNKAEKWVDIATHKAEETIGPVSSVKRNIETQREAASEAKKRGFEDVQEISEKEGERLMELGAYRRILGKLGLLQYDLNKELIASQDEDYRREEVKERIDKLHELSEMVPGQINAADIRDATEIKNPEALSRKTTGYKFLSNHGDSSDGYLGKVFDYKREAPVF